MLRPIDEWFLQKEEPAKSCLQYLRDLILKQDAHITESWKYGMPFFNYKEKRFCYLWVHKQFKKPYLGIVDGKRIVDPDLLTEKRARMKILLIDPEKDMPVQKIREILNEVLKLYK